MCPGDLTETALCTFDWPYSEAYRWNGLGHDSIAVGLRCEGEFDCIPTPLRLDRFVVGLEDREAPSIDRVSISPDLSRASVMASDHGGGIAGCMNTTMIDDVVRMTAQIADEYDACRPPFVDRVPCPLEYATDVPVRTTELADGPHVLRARVTDVANNSSLSQPVTVYTRAGAMVPEPAAASETSSAVGASTEMLQRASGAARPSIGRLQLVRRISALGVADGCVLVLPLRPPEG